MGSLLLKAIIQQLNYYIRSVADAGTLDPGTELAVLENIANSKFAGGTSENLGEKIVVSLVNISEEPSLKNNNPSRYINQQNVRLHPTVHVNLHLLFTANFEDYNTSINHIFRVLEFFQGRKVFKFKNAPISGVNEAELKRVGEIELTVELHTLSFEQLNDLWGSLGGKQLPFVLYRARLVPVQMERPVSKDGLVKEIDITSTHFN